MTPKAKKSNKTTGTTELNFEFHSDTKGTRRFSEVVEGSAEPVVGSLYIRKHALPALGDPQSVTLTITNAD